MFHVIKSAGLRWHMMHVQVIIVNSTYILAHWLNKLIVYYLYGTVIRIILIYITHT